MTSFLVYKDMSSGEFDREEACETGRAPDSGNSQPVCPDQTSEIAHSGPQALEDASGTDAAIAATVLRDCAELRDEQTWNRFVEVFNRVIVTSVVRGARRRGYSSVSAGMRDDLTQTVYVKLSQNQAKVLRDFETRQGATAYGFIRVVAYNVTLDYLRARGNEPGIGTGDLPPTGGPSDHNDARAALESGILMDQIDDLARSRLNKRSYRIFWLYYRRGWSAREIADDGGGLTVKGVESALRRIAHSIRKAIGRNGG